MKAIQSSSFGYAITASMCLLLVGNAAGQSVTNVVAKAEGETVQVSYDLAGNAGESYDVRLFVSRDGGKNFGESPSKVTGAVNRWEAPGTGKTITWDAKKDLGEFEGNLQFKVTATGKGGAVVSTTPTQSTTVVSNAGPGSSSGSTSADNAAINLTLTGVFNVPDGFKILFKVRAKQELDLAITTNTQVQDQFGNVYTVVSADVEGVGVLTGKSRKFMTGARKDGEMILKISKMNGATLNGRMLKSLSFDTNVGSLVLSDIPKL